MYSKLKEMTSAIPIERGANWLIDFLWPPACTVCAARTSATDSLCTHCWNRLKIWVGPRCNYCGVEVEGEAAPICRECYNQMRSWDYGISAVRYEGVARNMVLRIKKIGSDNIVHTMAKISFEQNREFFEEQEVLVPIPLHWRKKVVRGVNQAELLAYYLSKYCKASKEPKVLVRNRATRAQTQFSDFEGRFNNLEGAFSLANPNRIEGKRVCLVDDVFTSGASFENASRALRGGNPKSIAVFAFARAGV